jgi:amino acid transporter
MPSVDTTSVRSGPRPLLEPGRVLIVTSVMFAFIGTWRTAAVVLCDLASTSYYIGGIVESQIGKAAPWFILAVMAFSYAVRSAYIESCSMFVRGGVYKIVHEALGRGAAKVAVSALMFDYILTGPISAVSAGQYLVRLANVVLKYFHFRLEVSERWGSVGIAVAVVLYFYQANIRGVPTSSEKALKIMRATTVMAALVIGWCLLTLAVRPEARHLPPLAPDLSKKVDSEGKPKINEVTKAQEDPLGWIAETPVGPELRPGHVHWASLIGVLGIVIAFGHSILAMSGEETLAQVYREVKAPKLRNFKRAAFIVFVYSLMLTGLVSFFAVMIIPDSVRPRFQDNLISGLAMHVVGPHWARLALNGLVVVVGFLILAGAVNTSIIGANGVLSRVAEDGVLSDWFLQPHRNYGTTWRLLTLIAGLQLATVFLSRGNVILLGEAYAFGVVWSLVFNSLSMLVLRFKKSDKHREHRVPLNLRVGRREFPIGLALIFLVLLVSALANLMTKQVATVSGLIFAATFLAAFAASEHSRRAADGEADGREHKHLEQFSVAYPYEFEAESPRLRRPYRKVVAVESADELRTLDACLVESDPDSTAIVVLIAHPETESGPYGDPEHEDVLYVEPRNPPSPEPPLGEKDRATLTMVVNRAEIAGKPLTPLVILTEAPLCALARVARIVGAQEIFLPPAAGEAPSALLDHATARWSEEHDGSPAPLTVRVVGDGVDERREDVGGSRIPRAPDDGGETARLLAGSGTR